MSEKRGNIAVGGSYLGPAVEEQKGAVASGAGSPRQENGEVAREEGDNGEGLGRPLASPPEPEREEVETDPSVSATGAVTIAMAGTVPPAGVTPPPATNTMVETPRALRVKKAVMKKSSLSTSDMRCKPKPTAATPAPEPPASEEPTPKEPTLEADTMLPGLPPPSPNKPKPGLVNVITTDLVDDPTLTDDNIRYFKKISKELYNFTVDVIKHSQKKTEKLKVVTWSEDDESLTDGEDLQLLLGGELDEDDEDNMSWEGDFFSSEEEVDSSSIEADSVAGGYLLGGSLEDDDDDDDDEEDEDSSGFSSANGGDNGGDDDGSDDDSDASMAPPIKRR
ncbi:transcription initiation factor TFIID subunit 11-like [Panicum hallii]|uniref:transcription initiation factor TFIID subunit 11-like n=1 Tax=Panicum hallii TaxID=206008 RepID=UPI000DF4DC64|nr:transcription initiation factor TFIID subunit 11-like [Panicum hallii]